MDDLVIVDRVISYLYEHLCVDSPVDLAQFNRAIL